MKEDWKGLLTGITTKVNKMFTINREKLLRYKAGYKQICLVLISFGRNRIFWIIGTSTKTLKRRLPNNNQGSTG